MEVSDKGIALTKASEGCKLKAYPDPASGGAPWTIGWGSTGPDVKKGIVWTQKKADQRLLARLGTLAAAIQSKSKVTQGQLDALVDFAYNLGLGGLYNSTLWRKHKAGDYAGAAEEFPKWKFASGKVMNGLVTRRAKEQKLYKGDE